MHIQSAASAVLNTAAPGVAAAGVGADGAATGDALSPFAGVLEALLQPEAFGAANATSATPSLAGGAASADTSPEGTAASALATANASATGSSQAIILATQPITLALQRPTLQSLAPDSPTGQASAPSAATAPLTTSAALLTAREADKAIAGDAPSATASSALDNDDITLEPPAGALAVAVQPKGGAAVAEAAPSPKSKASKAAQSPSDANQVAIQASAAALIAPPPQPLPGVQGQTPQTASPTSAALSDAAAFPSPTIAPPAPPVQGDAQVASQTSSTAAASEAGQAAPTDGRALSLAAVQPPVASTAPQTPVSSTIGTAQVGRQAPTSSLQPSAQTAATPTTLAAQQSTAQQPSAVSQFVGRSRAGPASVSGSARTPSVAGRPTSFGAVAAGTTALETSGAGGAANSSSSQDFDGAADTPDPQSSDQDAQSAGPDASPATAAPTGDAAALATLVAAQAAPSNDLAPSVRGASDTVANLSAQIAQKAGGQTTRFDVQLDPNGLGRVNVSVQIDAKGTMSAALAFEKPEAAILLKTHSAELQQSLAQAGFNLSNASISFSTVDQTGRSAQSQTAFLGAGADGGGGQPSQGGQAQNAGRAFGAASLAADQADQITTASRSFSARGLDIRI